jgi:transposase
MAYIEGTHRLQMGLFCLEDFIASDAPVRVVDAFCSQVNYAALNFRGKFTNDNSRPNYHPSLLLRLYIYGYLNGIRSSRKLACECKRNLEVMWLCHSLVPRYHTIADFRKHHPAQIRDVFRQFVSLMCNWKLIGKKTVAIDSTKYRAQNSKKNNYNEAKIQRQLAYIDHKVAEYLQEMDLLDKRENKKQKDLKRLKELARDKEKMQARRKQYEALQLQLKSSPDTQISTVDGESRTLVIKTDIIEVAYNTQVATDDKHNLLVHYQVTNQNDRKALHPAALFAKENMGLGREDKLTALADKGYFNSEQLHACNRDNILTYVPGQGNQPHVGIPAPGYRGEDFIYHRKTDTYTCPQRHTLWSNNHWYKKVYTRSEKTKSYYLFKHYRTNACLQCPCLHLCTVNKSGRLIERGEYAEAVEQNLKRVKDHKDKYLRRQQIVEHAFGTIKRAWGYTYTLLKGLQKADADLGLVYLCYNLKRVINILTVEKLLKKLQFTGN